MNKRDRDAKLAKGAAAIHKAESETRSEGINEKWLIATRDIKAVLKDRVKFLPDHMGLKLHDDTSIAECLQVLDYVVAVGEHVQFWIGDVLNYGEAKWGKKYHQAIEQTGRAKSTLKHYASVARRIPVDRRKATLSFSHHLEVLKCADVGTIDKLLSDAATKAEKGNTPTVLELRERVKRLQDKAGPETRNDERKQSHKAAVDELVKKGIAKDERDARRILREAQDNEDGSAPASVVEQTSKGWTPPVIEESDLTSEELAVVVCVRDHLRSKPTERCNVFLRFLREKLECPE